MRKFPVIVALVLIIVGGAYALVVNLLPDNSRFPRVPTGDGTIGGAIAKILGTTDLANYIGDGTVANTNMLSGMTADKLLKAQDICLAPNVWIKTDANGKPVCGSSNMLAANIGTVQIDTCVGAAIAYRADGTMKTFSDGDIVLQGDIVQTDAGCPITIAFADLSLIRLDGGSTVSLDTGVTTGGQSIAYAILNNGGLWGRVLTENGEYRIGNDDIVAGVRGTSIQFTKEGASPTPTKNANGDWILPPATPGGTFQVVHSTQPGVNLECTKENTTTFVGTGKIATLPTSGDCTPTLSNLSVAGGSIYTNPTAPKVAENTLADLEYMSERRAVPRINTEFDITKPKNTKDKNDICDPTGTTSEEYWENLLLAGMEPCQPDVIAFADLTVSSNLYFKNGKTLEARYETGSSHDNILVNNGTFGIYTNPRSKVEWRTQATTAQQQSIWYYLDRNTPASPSCPAISKQAWVQGIYAKNPSNSSPIDILACPDYAQYPDGIWYLSGVISTTPGNGKSITNPGEYLTYPINSIGNLVEFSGGTLKGKTVTITLNGTPTNLGTLVDFGYDTDHTKSYRIRRLGSGYQCVWNLSTNCVTVDGNKLSFTVPSYVKYFIIGNNMDTLPPSTSSLTLPLNATIQKIQISN